MKQNGLFANLPVKQISVPKVWIPKPGDIVTLPNINDGIEAEIVSIDTDKLYDEFAHPIKCWIPRLKMHVWQQLPQVNKK